MPMRNLQPGIGDNNDLLVRLRTNTKDADTSSVIYPEIAEGTYYTYTDDSTEIQEFPVFAEPSELEVSEDIKSISNNRIISIPIDKEPATKVPPYVVLKTATEFKRFALVPNLLMVDELPINMYSISRPVQSINGKVLHFTDVSRFPKNISVGSICFNEDDPETQYVVKSFTTTTITLDRDVT